MKRAHLHGALFGIAAVVTLAAEAPPVARPFQPPVNRSNVVRVWGNPRMAGVVRAWTEGFQRVHPEWTIESRLDGTGLVMPGIYTGAADVALFGRDTNTTDNDGFQHVLNYQPLRIEIGTGGLDVPRRSCPLAIFVHRDNPLTRITLAELDAAFGAERRRGVPTAIQTWGELGLSGKWARRPIHLYVYDTRSGPGTFFRHAALLDSEKLNWEHLAEFSDRKGADGRVQRAGEQITAALAADPLGLAVATLADARPEVKPLAIAAADGGEFLLPTHETVRTRRYPFARPVFACVNKPPGAALDAKVRDFLAYVLSPAGQDALAHGGEYQSLSAELLRAQEAKLQ